jgi:hypothetical protein
MSAPNTKRRSLRTGRRPRSTAFSRDCVFGRARRIGRGGSYRALLLKVQPRPRRTEGVGRRDGDSGATEAAAALHRATLAVEIQQDKGVVGGGWPFRGDAKLRNGGREIVCRLPPSRLFCDHGSHHGSGVSVRSDGRLQTRFRYRPALPMGRSDPRPTQQPRRKNEEPARGREAPTGESIVSYVAQPHSRSHACPDVSVAGPGCRVTGRRRECRVGERRRPHDPVPVRVT